MENQGPSERRKPIIMISSPYGFSDQWKTLLLPKFVSILREMGAEVWECFERCKDVDFTDKNWEYVIA